MSLLEMRDISKTFGSNKALQNVHLTVEAGEIVALMGENGAGKSTLMNILTGVYEIDTGKITFDGKVYPSPTIAQMEDAGIAFVHQELNVINDLTVAENIFLNRELKKNFLLLDSKKMIKETKELFESLGVEIDPTVMVSTLKTSEKQLLEICRALHMNAKLLILDEPTTALSNEEIDKLFGILRNLKKQGKSFIFISHKMPEVFSIADSYTVYRNGQFVSEGKISDTSPEQMTSDMTGVAYVNKDIYQKRELGDVILSLKDLSGEGFKNINLDIRKGEVLALTGLAACGASELIETLFGALPIEGGKVTLNGKELSGSIKKFMRSGAGMLPANRRENSVITDLPIIENMYCAEHIVNKGNPFIKDSKEVERYNAHKETLSIKAENPFDSIASLSGGNQQKVFLARWLNADVDILLFNNPTQGVDVGAKSEIYELIMEIAKKGKTVIINTLEIPEIMKVADRCAVLYEGEIVKIFDHKDINEVDVMMYSTNAINVNVKGDK